jgi:hypothetical protein
MSAAATVVPMPDNDRAPIEAAEVTTTRLTDGATFILSAEESVPAAWGHHGTEVVWAEGEPLMIAGPQGVGKTTLMQQLALRRAGVTDGDLLGMPVRPSAGRVLYIAADRPRQAARSFRRMVGEADHDRLAEKLVVWPGPLPFELGKCQRGEFARFVAGIGGVTDVFIDSLKDVAVKLTEDDVGGRVNGEVQEVVAQGIEVVIGHHQRKASGDNRQPRKLADVYGSTWLTSGCGSVLLLWGEAGDALVEAVHLKQPAAEVGPLKLKHDHDAGIASLHDPDATDLIALARDSLGGLTAKVAAVALFTTNEPTANEVEKARGKLKRHKGLEQDPDDPAKFRPRVAS